MPSRAELFHAMPPNQSAKPPAARQTMLKRELRVALAAGDDAGCWTMLERADSSEGDCLRIMKLLAVNGSYFSFLSHRQDHETLKADCWLLHEDEFFVHWVRSGRNSVGCVLEGEDLEDTFFMNTCPSFQPQ
jgi:hypothetical protein